MSTDTPSPAPSPKSGRPARTRGPAFATIPQRLRRPRADARPKPAFATVSSPYFPVLVGAFVGVMIISNITGTKAVSLWTDSLRFDLLGIHFTGLPTDGAFFLFPLAYVLGDVISEVYGFKAMRRVIATGFAVLCLASACLWIATLLPAPPDGREHADAFASVVGVVPMLLVAGLSGYLVGEFMNSYVLVRMKAWTGERHLWSRLLGSTVVGEFFDTLVFCLIAGPVIGWTGPELVAYTVLGFVWKTLVEIVIMPLSYALCAFLKRREPSYQQALAAI